jgi:hypothetical protein
MSDDYICKVCGHLSGRHMVSNICLVDGCHCRDDPYLEQLAILHKQWEEEHIAAIKITERWIAKSKQLDVAKERIIDAMTYETCPAGVWNILNNALQLIDSKGNNIEYPTEIERIGEKHE